MAGFTSMDDLINEMTVNGKQRRVDWQKSMLPTTAAVVGEWSCLARGAGNPGAATIFNTGTNLTWQQLKDTTTTAAGIQHGGDVSPDYKVIVNASGFTTGATIAPCQLMLVDMLGFYRVTTTTTITSQAVTNTLVAFSTFTVDASTDTITHSNINMLNLSTIQVSSSGTLPAGLSAATNYFVIKLTDTTFKLATTYANAVAATPIDITDAGSGTHTINTLLPRYTNGSGVQAIMWANNATPLGAGTPNLTLSSYTNSVATTARVSQAVSGKTAAADGLILYSGLGSGKTGPFMPLANGDGGVRSVENIQLSSTYTSGELSVGLVRPLLVLPLTTLGVPAERDLVNQLPSMPRVYDGACLIWLMAHGAATTVSTPMSGHLDFAWG